MIDGKEVAFALMGKLHDHLSIYHDATPGSWGFGKYEGAILITKRLIGTKTEADIHDVLSQLSDSPGLWFHLGRSHDFFMGYTANEPLPFNPSTFNDGIVEYVQLNRSVQLHLIRYDYREVE